MNISESPDRGHLGGGNPTVLPRVAGERILWNGLDQFSHIDAAPQDPIFGLMAEYGRDKRADKVSLAAGIYGNEVGLLPPMNAVTQARALFEKDYQDPKSKFVPYLPTVGHEAFGHAVSKLAFGEELYNHLGGRIGAMQAVGGTGALYLGAYAAAKLLKVPEVHLSNPTWANHFGPYKFLGVPTKQYRYYDRTRRELTFNETVEDLGKATNGSMVLLHACCHNPSGADPSREQWHKLLDICDHKQLIPFFDNAYQGLGDGLDIDAYAIRLFAESGIPMLVASSFSKSMSLYSSRVGCLMVVTTDPEYTGSVISQIGAHARATYSNPPREGADIAYRVLTNPSLTTTWHQELGEVRDRINTMRSRFANLLNSKGTPSDMSFIKDQHGMFSFSGLSEEGVKWLKSEHAIYVVGGGRINLAGLNESNIERVAEKVAEALRTFRD